MMIDQRGVARRAADRQLHGRPLVFYVRKRSNESSSRDSACGASASEWDRLRYCMAPLSSAYNVVADGQFAFAAHRSRSGHRFRVGHAQRPAPDVVVYGQCGHGRDVWRRDPKWGATRSYPFNFCPRGVQWTKIVVAIPGDTGGTWVMRGNATGLNICFRPRFRIDFSWSCQRLVERELSRRDWRGQHRRDQQPRMFS